MVQVQKLTAEALLEAPRRGAAIPNHDGSLVLYTVSTYNFGDKKTKNEIRTMNPDTQQSFLISDENGSHDATWIPGTSEVLFLKSLDEGRTQAIVASGFGLLEQRYTIADFDSPIQHLKLKRLNDGSIAFVVTGLVDQDGHLYNEEAQEKRSTGRIFDSCRIRTYNVLSKQQPHSLWYNKLQQVHGKWELAGYLLNLINDPRLDAPAAMADSEDFLNNFDVSHRGIAFLAQEQIVLDPRYCVYRSAYFIPLDSFTLPPTSQPKRISLPSGEKSAVLSNIRFSPDGFRIGFLHAGQGNPYQGQLLLTSAGCLSALDVFSLLAIENGPEDDPPLGFEFAGSSEHIILMRVKCGRSVLSRLQLQNGEVNHDFFSGSGVIAYHPIRDHDWRQIVVSGSSFIDSSLWQIVDVSKAATIKVISSATKGGIKFGISSNMVTEFWYQGADNVCVQSYMLRPSDFDKHKEYPWVLMPHGGPVSCWDDSWSTKWNLAAWAEQGYVVICPNITGSMGFGVEFAKRIDNNWGGRAFKDLVNLIAYLETIPYLDQNKAVLAGFSYGGYMISWMMGHEIINKFCCAIWHAGIYNLPSFQLQTDLLYDDGSFGGVVFPWENPNAFEKFNPAQAELVRNWHKAPPTLVIHNEKDYRCPITEGIAVFNTLKASGVPSRFLTFSDEGHFVLDPENSLLWYHTVWAWANRCVRGELKRGDAGW